MKLVVFLVLNSLQLSICGFINKGFMQYEVDLSVFSGRSSPSWIVSRNNPLYSRIAFSLSRSKSTRMGEKLGYRGFGVEMRNPFGQRMVKSIGAGTNPRLELLLLNSSPFPIKPSVRRHVIDTIRKSAPFQPYISIRPGPFARPGLPIRRCRLPRFDPENWNVPPTIRRNNCYNYATQRQSDTFAQPGRASGRGFGRPMTPGGVFRATVRDGLIPLPFFNPRMFPGMCYIALVIWPDTDFHYYRLDSNLLWSHKPGRTAAKNTDDSGNLIEDPRLCDRGNYVIFAGYLGNHPGVRVI